MDVTYKRFTVAMTDAVTGAKNYRLFFSASVTGLDYVGVGDSVEDAVKDCLRHIGNMGAC
jgi:hypothetical protein